MNLTPEDQLFVMSVEADYYEMIEKLKTLSSIFDTAIHISFDPKTEAEVRLLQNFYTAMVSVKDFHESMIGLFEAIVIAHGHQNLLHT